MKCASDIKYGGRCYRISDTSILKSLCNVYRKLNRRLAGINDEPVDLLLNFKRPVKRGDMSATKMSTVVHKRIYLNCDTTFNYPVHEYDQEMRFYGFGFCKIQSIFNQQWKGMDYAAALFNIDKVIHTWVRSSYKILLNLKSYWKGYISLSSQVVDFLRLPVLDTSHLWLLSSMPVISCTYVYTWFSYNFHFLYLVTFFSKLSSCMKKKYLKILRPSVYLSVRPLARLSAFRHTTLAFDVVDLEIWKLAQRWLKSTYR